MVIIIFALLDVLGEAPPDLTSESDAYCFLFSFFNFMFYCYLKRDIYKEIRIKKKVMFKYTKNKARLPRARQIDGL